MNQEVVWFVTFMCPNGQRNTEVKTSKGIMYLNNVFKQYERKTINKNSVPEVGTCIVTHPLLPRKGDEPRPLYLG